MTRQLVLIHGRSQENKNATELQAEWVAAIENKTNVDNPTENRHGISGYLSDAVVAKRIYDALTR